MSEVTKQLRDVLRDKPVRDGRKLQAQQAYYDRLLREGIARKERYNLSMDTIILPEPSPRELGLREALRKPRNGRIPLSEAKAD